MKPTTSACRVAPCVFTLLGACSNPIDRSQNALPYLTGLDTAEVADSAPEVAGGACDCLTVGRWYRFDSLALTSIDGKDHPVIATLNNLWQSDIAALELDLMLEVTAASPTSVTTRVLNGARVDGTQTICALEDTAVDIIFPRDGCRLETSNESAFNVYAGTQDYPKNCTTTLPVKHAIPVAKARLDGELSPDCGQILAGKVPSGALGQAELGQICTCLVLPGTPAEDCGALDPGFNETACLGCNANYKSLSQLLTAFGAIDWLCQTESDGPAACITADFSAVAMAVGPAPCGP